MVWSVFSGIVKWRAECFVVSGLPWALLTTYKLKAHDWSKILRTFGA